MPYRKNLAQQLAHRQEIAVSRDKVKKLRALLKTAPTPTRRGNPSPEGLCLPKWTDKSHNDAYRSST